jgi:NADPH:quinone reductase-like Zn-dependent oxidoreductase
MARLKMYGLASKSKQHILTQYRAMPIDYRAQNFVEVIRQAEPGGIDVVLDGMMRVDYIRAALPLLQHGGRLVSFGEPSGFGALARVLATAAKVNLFPNGRRSFKLYGTSFYFLGDKRPYLEDWATLFKLLEEGKIKPVIAKKFPLLEAARANELLESGQVIGNVVLTASELL